MVTKSRLLQTYGDHKSGNPAVALVFAHRCHELEMSHEEIARRVGVSRSTISRVFSGRRMPSMKLAMSLCHELGIKVDEIYSALESSAMAGVQCGCTEDDMFFAEVCADRRGRGRGPKGAGYP